MAKENEELTAKVFQLAEMIGYQDGAVVSRTLISKQNGTVTAFAFDKEQYLSEHTAPFDAMVQVLDGEVEVSIAKKPHRLKAGEMIIMPANLPHALKALSQFKMLLTMVKS